MGLIPGLPNDIARQCLFRVHYTQLSIMPLVCKAWKIELQSPEFRRCRKQACRHGEPLILLSCTTNLLSKLILLEPAIRTWSQLPCIPAFPDGVPMDSFEFRFTSYRSGFVVVIGSNKLDWDSSHGRNTVFVFDYLLGTWRQGADMPKGQLAVYRCTSDRDRMVYVLCQHKGYPECIMVYDAMKDEWTTRIDAREPEGSNDTSCGSMGGMIYHNGKIHFHDHWIQGGHDLKKRVIDVSTGQWDPPAYNFLDNMAHELCTLSDDGEWYSFRRRYTEIRPGNKSYYIELSVTTYKDSTWQEIGQIYDKEFCDYKYITTWKSKLVMIFNRWETERFGAIVFDLENHKSTTLVPPEEFPAGEVDTGCYLEI